MRKNVKRGRNTSEKWKKLQRIDIVQVKDQRTSSKRSTKSQLNKES